MDSLDPFGEKNALRELGLAKGVSQEEIKAKYRELSKVIFTWFRKVHVRLCRFTTLTR